MLFAAVQGRKPIDTIGDEVSHTQPLMNDTRLSEYDLRLVQTDYVFRTKLRLFYEYL